MLEEEGVRFTPFNLREELAEGHFDAAGNYFPRGDDGPPDAWLDSLDWVRPGIGVGDTAGQRNGTGRHWGELGWEERDTGRHWGGRRGLCRVPGGTGTDWDGRWGARGEGVGR